MAPKIRVGLVGASPTGAGAGWAQKAHLPALRALPDYELKAVCTAHEATAQAAREVYGAELAYDNINDIVANPDIDLIVVSVRVPIHHSLVMTSLRAGKPTFCEWPLAANLAQAREMASLAHDMGLATAAGLQSRSDPVVLYAKELIQDGLLAKCSRRT